MFDRVTMNETSCFHVNQDEGIDVMWHRFTKDEIYVYVKLWGHETSGNAKQGFWYFITNVKGDDIKISIFKNMTSTTPFDWLLWFERLQVNGWTRRIDILHRLENIGRSAKLIRSFRIEPITNALLYLEERVNPKKRLSIFGKTHFLSTNLQNFEDCLRTTVIWYVKQNKYIYMYLKVCRKLDVKLYYTTKYFSVSDFLYFFFSIRC